LQAFSVLPFQQTTDLVEKLRAQNVAVKAIGALSAQPPWEKLPRSDDGQSRAHSTPTPRSARDTRALRRVSLPLNLSAANSPIAKSIRGFKSPSREAEMPPDVTV